jgi:hypothetical protein
MIKQSDALYNKIIPISFKLNFSYDIFCNLTFSFYHSDEIYHVTVITTSSYTFVRYVKPTLWVFENDLTTRLYRIIYDGLGIIRHDFIRGSDLHTFKKGLELAKIKDPRFWKTLQ